MSDTKACIRCKRVLHLSRFYKDKRKSDGLWGKCKDCVNKKAPMDRKKQSSDDPPLCFFFKVCKGPATLEKNGKFICSKCEDRLPGNSYPLRSRRYKPLSAGAAQELVHQLGMGE